MQILIYYITSLLECFLVSGIGLALIGVRLSIKRLFAMGTILLVFSLIIRRIYYIYGLPLGTHSLIIFVFKVNLIVILGKQNILNGIISALLSYLLLVIGETVMICNMYYALNIKPDYLKDSYIMGSYFGILVDVFLLVVFYITYIKGFTIINISKEAG